MDTSVRDPNYDHMPNAQGTNSTSSTDSLIGKQSRMQMISADDIWNIKPDDLVMEEEVGRGAFGAVFRGKWRSTPVAIKQVITTNMSTKDMEDFKAEVNLMKNLRPHANVILLLGVCPQPLSIVTEFMEKGSLYGYLQKTELTQQQQLSVIRGIARGMLHLHFENVIHRDLAARNILLTAAMEPKIFRFWSFESKCK